MIPISISLFCHLREPGTNNIVVAKSTEATIQTLASNIILSKRKQGSLEKCLILGIDRKYTNHLGAFHTAKSKKVL